MHWTSRKRRNRKGINMEEKTIINGKLKNVSRTTLILFLILTIVPLCVLFFIQYKDAVADVAGWNMKWDWVIERYGENATPLKVALIDMFRPLTNLFVFAPGIIISLLFYASYHKTELTVTNRRVFGKSSWGKRVDLPLDSISAVGTGWMKSISVTSSSGAIKFGMIKNRDEVHKAISDLLIERQEKAKTEMTTSIRQEIPQSNADELTKFKGLLDQGVISQEEFDAKKKQLLGL